jgi:hypothetical protein
VERARQREEVARRRPAECGAASDARDILQLPELREDGVGEALVGDEGSDAVEAGIDCRFGSERVAEPVSHKSATHRSRRAVEDREKAAFRDAGTQCALDLERAERGRVDGKMLPARDAAGRHQMRNAPGGAVGHLVGGLRLERVAQDRARCGNRGVVVREAEAIERAHAELGRQRVERILRAEVPALSRGHGEAPRRETRELGMRRAVALLGMHDLAW